MRKVTITTTVYSYSDLDPDAQQNALIALYDINVEYDWWDTVYEGAENIGLKITSFDEHSLEGDLCLDPLDIAKRIEENHGPDCETWDTAVNFLADYDLIPLDADGDKDEETLEDLEADFSRCLRGDYRIMLMKEYEYLTSEQAIVETIESNEYEFTQDGEIFHGFSGETTYQDIPA